MEKEDQDKEDLKLAIIVDEAYGLYCTYWNDSSRSSDCSRMRSLYASKLREHIKQTSAQNTELMVTEGPEGPDFIDGLTAAMFTRVTKTSVSLRLTSKGDPSVVQSVLDQWFFDQWDELERGGELATLYPYSGYSLSTVDDPGGDLTSHVSVEAHAPWEMIIDHQARNQKRARYVGVIRREPIFSLKEKYPDGSWSSSNTDLEGEVSTADRTTVDLEMMNFMSSDQDMARIIEFYDLIRGKRIIYSPEYRAEGKPGLTAHVLMIEDIPRGPSGLMVMVFPLMYGRIPDRPLNGVSPVLRMYDSFLAHAIGLTKVVDSALRTKRTQYAESGTALSQDERKLVELGKDLSHGGERKKESLWWDSPPPVPVDVRSTIELSSQSIQSGTLLGQFKSFDGAAYGSQALVGIIAAYQSSTVGRYARRRDNVFANIASVVVDMFHILAKGGDGEAVFSGSEVKILQRKTLEGPWKIQIKDHGSTMVSSAISKQDFVRLIPMLKELGVPNQKVLDHLIMSYELPVSWATSKEQARPVDQAAKAEATTGELAAITQTF